MRSPADVSWRGRSCRLSTRQQLGCGQLTGADRPVVVGVGKPAARGTARAGGRPLAAPLGLELLDLLVQSVLLGERLVEPAPEVVAGAERLVALGLERVGRPASSLRRGRRSPRRGRRAPRRVRRRRGCARRRRGRARPPSRRPRPGGVELVLHPAVAAQGHLAVAEGLVARPATPVALRDQDVALALGRVALLERLVALGLHARAGAHGGLAIADRLFEAAVERLVLDLRLRSRSWSSVTLSSGGAGSCDAVAGQASGTVTLGATDSAVRRGSMRPSSQGNSAIHGSASAGHGLCSSVASTSLPSTISVGRTNRRPRTPCQRPRTTTCPPETSSESSWNRIAGSRATGRTRRGGHPSATTRLCRVATAR